ncbi:MAG TPA: hypothetical protein VII86_11325, partial [Thermoanaerobaculia bacterium]
CSLDKKQEIGQVLALGSRIDGIEVSADGSIAVVRSGRWAHQLQINETGMRVVNSMYLPTLRGTHTLLESNGQAIRAWLEWNDGPQIIRFDRSDIPELKDDVQDRLAQLQRAFNLSFNKAGLVVQYWPDLDSGAPTLDGIGRSPSLTNGTGTR